MRRRRGSRLVATATAACIVLSAAGCGSSGNGLSRAALIARIDPICKRHNEVITAAASKVLAGGRLPGPAVFGKLAHQTIIPQYASEITRLGELKPAAGVAEPYRAWLAHSRVTLARMRQDPRIITSAANFTAVNSEAHALGLSRFCNVGPG